MQIVKILMVIVWNHRNPINIMGNFTEDGDESGVLADIEWIKCFF